MLSNDTSGLTKEKREEEGGIELPTAAILCFAIGLYLLLILIGVLVRKCLLARGFCTSCNPKMDTSGCCGSCTGFAQQCSCKLPTVDSCLDMICPAKQRINCIEFLVCDWASMQCCSEGGTYTCGSGDYQCTCEAPQCETINCLCCEISFRSASTEMTT